MEKAIPLQDMLPGTVKNEAVIWLNPKKQLIEQNATQNIVSCVIVLHFSENSKTWHTFSGNRVPKCAIFIVEGQ